MNTTTGYLNHFINKSHCQNVLNYHKGLSEELIKFKPKEKNKREFMSAYKAFLKHKDKLDLTKFNFMAETVNSESFGKKVFYKSKFEHFFWAELFEYAHLF